MCQSRTSKPQAKVGVRLAHFGMCQDCANVKAFSAWRYDGSKNAFSSGLNAVWKDLFSS